jgi:hypothetical protein
MVVLATGVSNTEPATGHQHQGTGRVSILNRSYYQVGARRGTCPCAHVNHLSQVASLNHDPHPKQPRSDRCRTFWSPHMLTILLECRFSDLVGHLAVNHTLGPLRF